jgi:hypothetical protein
LQSALLGRTRHGRAVRVASAVSCRSRGGQEPARRFPKKKKKNRLVTRMHITQITNNHILLVIAYSSGPVYLLLGAC